MAQLTCCELIHMAIVWHMGNLYGFDKMLMWCEPGAVASNSRNNTTKIQQRNANNFVTTYYVCVCMISNGSFNMFKLLFGR